jgi:hypothetical protein
VRPTFLQNDPTVIIRIPIEIGSALREMIAEQGLDERGFPTLARPADENHLFGEIVEHVSDKIPRRLFCSVLENGHGYFPVHCKIAIGKCGRIGFDLPGSTHLVLPCHQIPQTHVPSIP